MNSSFEQLNFSVFHGDARERLKELDDNSVHLIVTSPPYGNIKEYSGKMNEIGFNQNVSEFHKSLNEVWKECVRILHPGCRLVINIGDEFVRKTHELPFHIIPHNSLIISNILSNYSNTMHFNGTILWNKVTTSKTSGGGKVMGSVFTPRDGHFFVNYEHIMVFKKIGKGPKISKIRREQSKFTIEERRVWFKDNWELHPERQTNHIAMFPFELPERIIRMYSFVGDVVLDPFLGSGTTMAAAMKTNRSCIGVELGFNGNSNWKEVIMEKVSKYGDYQIQFL